MTSAAYSLASLAERITSGDIAWLLRELGSGNARPASGPGEARCLPEVVTQVPPPLGRVFASGFDVSPEVAALLPSQLSLLVKLEDVLDELFAGVEIGGLQLLDDFRKVDEVEFCGLIEDA